jgi:hypothetical protein
MFTFVSVRTIHARESTSLENNTDHSPGHSMMCKTREIFLCEVTR